MQVFFRSKTDTATMLCIFLEDPKRHGREVEADVAEPRFLEGLVEAITSR